MADALETYLRTDHAVERASVEELGAIVEELLRRFRDFFIPEVGTWPYLLIAGGTPDPPEVISFSTTAMIAFSLGLATGQIRESSLAPAIGDPRGSPAERKQIATIVEEAMAALGRQAKEGISKETLEKRKEFPEPNPSPALTDSATFGWDDPLTLSWLLEVLTAAPVEGPAAELLTAVRARARARAGLLLANPSGPHLQ